MKSYRMMDDMFVINKIYIEDIIEHSLQDDPNECCGILVGKDGVVEKVCRMTNTAKSPYRYDMDPLELDNNFGLRGQRLWTGINCYISFSYP